MHSFYGIVGSPPTVEGAIAGIASVLVSKATDEQIQTALSNCTTELYPVRLPHILAKLPGGTADIAAEKRLAWDVAERFAGKWLRWNCERTGAFIADGAPKLHPRIVDSVRRSGGWTVYLSMNDGDFPFIQRRFFEEYEAWTEVVGMGDRLLETPAPEVKQLAESRAMEPPRSQEPPGPRASPWSPAKRRIMQAIENLRKRSDS